MTSIIAAQDAYFPGNYLWSLGGGAGRGRGEGGGGAQQRRAPQARAPGTRWHFPENREE